MKILILAIILLPLTVSLSFNGVPIQVVGCSALLKGFEHMADSADSLFRGCSSPPHPRPIPPPEPPNINPSRDPLSIFSEVVVRPLDGPSNKSDWPELPNEVIHKSDLHVSQLAKLSNDSFLNKVRNPHLLIAMPTTLPQYMTIYKKNSVSGGAEEELKKFNNNILNTRNSSKISDGANQLWREIDSTDDEFVVVFAHSENDGSKVVLPNGETVTDNEIHEHCANAKKIKVCVVLTCYGDDFDIKEKITAAEALSMWDAALKTVMEKHTPGEEPSIYDFIYLMRQKRHQLKTNERTKIVVTASGPVGLIYYHYSSEEK